MTITSLLILLAFCLGALVFSSVQMILLKRLMQQFYHKNIPQVIRTNALQIVMLLWQLLLFVMVWAGSHYLSRDFGIPKQVARLCLALCLIVPMFFATVRLNAERTKKTVRTPRYRR